MLPLYDAHETHAVLNRIRPEGVLDIYRPKFVLKCFLDMLWWNPLNMLLQERLFYEIKTENCYLKNFISFGSAYTLVSPGYLFFFVNKANLKCLPSNSSLSLTYSKGLLDSRFGYSFATVCIISVRRLHSRSYV